MLYPTELRPPDWLRTDFLIVMVVVVMFAAMRVHLRLAFHEGASSAIGQHTVSHSGPLLDSRILQHRLELGSVGCFDQLVLIAFVGHALILRESPACGTAELRLQGRREEARRWPR